MEWDSLPEIRPQLRRTCGPKKSIWRDIGLNSSLSRDLRALGANAVFMISAPVILTSSWAYFGRTRLKFSGPIARAFAPGISSVLSFGCLWGGTKLAAATVALRISNTIRCGKIVQACHHSLCTRCHLRVISDAAGTFPGSSSTSSHRRNKACGTHFDERHLWNCVSGVYKVKPSQGLN
jgi:hypothetical protein